MNFLLFAYLVILYAFLSSVDFHKIKVFKLIFQEYHQSVKQFWSRSDLTFFQAWSGSKLFAKNISRWQKSPLVGKELNFRTNIWGICSKFSKGGLVMKLNPYHSLGWFSRQQIDNIFLIFPIKTEFDISCKLPPLETFCLKCQILFSGKNEKNISKCHLLKILTRVLSV